MRNYKYTKQFNNDVYQGIEQVLTSLVDSFNANPIEAELNEIKKQQVEKIKSISSTHSDDYLLIESKLTDIQHIIAKSNNSTELIVKAQTCGEAFELTYKLIIEHRKSLASTVYTNLKNIARKLKNYEKLFYGFFLLIPLNNRNIKEFTANLKSQALGMKLIAEAVENNSSNNWITENNRDDFKSLATINLHLESKMDLKDWKDSKDLFFTYKKILHSSANFILWKLEGDSPDIFGTVEEVNSPELPTRFSYRNIYEQIGKSAQSQENQRIIELLRAWREEDKVSDS